MLIIGKYYRMSQSCCCCCSSNSSSCCCCCYCSSNSSSCCVAVVMWCQVLTAKTSLKWKGRMTGGLPETGLNSRATKVSCIIIFLLLLCLCCVNLDTLLLFFLPFFILFHLCRIWHSVLIHENKPDRLETLTQ